MLSFKRLLSTRLSSKRTAVAIPLAIAALALGCGDSNPTATPEGSASATAGARAKPGSLAPAPKVDPLVMKTYRAEACYYGTLSLKAARTAYLGSLNGAEPGPGKIPDFGVDMTEPPAKDAPKPTSPAGSAKPAEMPTPAGSGKAAAAPKGSGAPAAPKSSAVAAAPKGSGAPAAANAPAGDRNDPRQRMRSVPYERFARSCSVAAGLKNPAAATLDPIMTDYAKWAIDLSQNLAKANTYYQKEEHKTDDFAKGKAFHKTIVDGFAQLDAQQKKLSDALAAWEKENPVDRSKDTESQKLAVTAIDASRDVLLKLDQSPIELEALKGSVTKLEEATAALKKYGEDNKDKNDPWARILVPALESYSKEARTIADTPDLKTPEASKMLNAITFYTRVLESNHRALTRSLAETNGGNARPNPRLVRPKMPAGHPE